MKILKSGFFAFIAVFALQYANAEDDDELLFPVGNKKGKYGALFERTDSDEVKIRKVLAYCDSQRDFVATGVSPCEKKEERRQK